MKRFIPMLLLFAMCMICAPPMVSAVDIANKEEKRLLLFAEMKLPGEAWLEFKIDKNNVLTQTATFRPLGVMGRLYWYSVLPFHEFIFKGMINKIAEK